MSEERKGLFTPVQEQFLAEVLDKFFEFKNPLYEKFDSVVFKTILKVADDAGVNKLSADWKAKLIPVIDAAMAGNVEDVRTYLIDLLNSKIDIPKLDEEQELMVFDSFTKFLAAAIDFYVQKNKKQ